MAFNGHISNFVLKATTGVGATLVTLNDIPDWARANGGWVELDIGTPEAEKRLVTATNISGSVATIAALRFAHALDDRAEWSSVPTLNVHKFGASPSASAATNTSAFSACIAEAENFGAAAKPKIIIPSGAYNITSLTLGATNKMHYLLEGETYGSVTLVGTTDGVNVLNIAGREVHLRNLIIDADTTRRAGTTGHGIYAAGAAGASISRLVLEKVRVRYQPQDGIHTTEAAELHYWLNVDSEYNKRYGAYILYAAVTQPWNNAYINVRLNDNTDKGLYLYQGAYCTFINLQAYDNGGTEQALISGGRSVVLINPDFENQDDKNDTGANNVGLVLAGSLHRVMGGHWSSLNKAISLESADSCIIEMPYITNASANFAMAAGITIDANSQFNELHLPDGENGNVTTLYTESSVANCKTTVFRSGLIRAPQIHVPRQTVAFADPLELDVSKGGHWTVNALTAAITISPPINMVAGDILKIVFSQDGTGGRNVTFDAVFHGAYSNTGNTANKVCVIQYHYTGSVWLMDYFSGWYS